MKPILRRSFPMLVAIPILVSQALPAPAATIVVDTAADTDTVDGFCSLREAILAANGDVVHGDCPSGHGADRIAFDLPAPATITLSDHLPAITAPLAIRGPRGAHVVIDGDAQYRPLTLDSPTDDGWTLIQGVDLTNGRTPPDDPYGGGASVAAGEVAIFRRVRFVANRAENGGGGLTAWSSTTASAQVLLIDCALVDNVAEGPTGGGGFYVTGAATEITFRGSLLVGNATEHDNALGAAGRISNGTLEIEGSTLSGNTANANGGALSLASNFTNTAVVEIRNSTITDNTASADGTGGGGGGLDIVSGVDSSVSLLLTNTVVAGNRDLGIAAGPDLSCSGTLDLVSASSSFVGSNARCETVFPAGTPNADGAFVGTAAAPLDALLDPLSDHGGPTAIHRPLPSSPLIDQGSCLDAVTDQRGFGNGVTRVRPVDVAAVPNAAGGDGCDIGAFEVQAEAGTAAFVFGDDFETGHALLWDGEVP